MSRIRAAAVLLLLGASLTPSYSPLSAQERDSSPNSDARLVAEVDAIRPGEPFTLGIHVTLDEGWHTYWVSAGDAGTGMLTDWDLPDGFSVDSLLYPVPERIPYPPLLNYGYHDEVLLLARVTPPADLQPGTTVRVATDAEWLVCEDICIPARHELELELPVATGAVAASPDAPLFDTWRGRMPVRSQAWDLRAARTGSGYVLAARPPEDWPGSLAGAYFFSADPGALEHTPEQPAGMADGEVRLRLPESPYLLEEPERLEGVLKLPEGSSVDAAGHPGLLVSVPVERGEAGAWALEPTEPLATPVAQAGTAAASGGLSLAAALLFALVGGLILNLMPCVFPILSLKALGFATRGGDRAGMRRDGLAFGAGVVLSFLVVAGILMAVRASGAQVGWGYQLQSPAIVAILATLMFVIGLMLAGVVEIGASLTRLGGIAAAPPSGGAPGRSGDGPGSSFLTGVLATVVATPCTAPFMGAAIGTALVRPPVEGLAVFAGLGVGMAAPYVILSFQPAMARRLPRPGRWMETFKQVLAFPMFAVAIWLLWVFGLQVGIGGAARLLFALLLVAMAAWFIGRWPATTASPRVRTITRGAAAIALVLALIAGVGATRGGVMISEGAEPAAAASLDWQPFSDEAVEALRAEGRAVFVDFTAAWCISCQVNERMALETRAVRNAFAERDVALLKADWTRRDPAITRALERFGRSGVPLYVLYPADPSAEPRILPELLTQKIVLDALAELPVADGTNDETSVARES